MEINNDIWGRIIKTR